jgi:Divergent InlB B-repeat domain
VRARLGVLAAAAAAVFFAGFPSIAHAIVPTTSCAASARAQADRRPDVLAGPSVQVIYAHPVNGPDNFGAMASEIATDIATGNAWFLREDPTRVPRWDLFPFANCGNDLGRLDIADVTLPGSIAAYASPAGRWQRIRGQLSGAPFGFDSSFKKYLVYYDAPVSDVELCGQGGGAPTGQGYAIMYVQACGQTVGDGGLATAVTFHELLHTFGVVGAGAPHECPPPNNGHTCDPAQVRDILYPFTFGEPLDALFLDPGRDDYWGGGPVDGRKSPFLVHLDEREQQLTVAHTGPAGLVASNLPGVFCSETCVSSWTAGTRVELVARASTGSRFLGWRGACSGLSTCSVTLDRTTAVTAAFVAATQKLQVAIRGKGTVTSSPAGLSCSRACSASFSGGSTVRLTAKAARGYRFVSWSGGCSGRGGCSVALSGDKHVTATFAKR